MARYLDEALIQYAKDGVYPFHMPGHKRNIGDFPDAVSIDITEIDGFDNLHDAKGIIKEAEQRAADCYGSRRCYYLVNGSTCGILAAVSAAAHRGDKVIVARNCHKAVYHAIQINGLDPVYIYPDISEAGIQMDIKPETVSKALDKALQIGASTDEVIAAAIDGEATTNADETVMVGEMPGVAAVIITSPTYEGVVSDISAISRICHEKNVPLIVDEAHGAHLGFGGGFPENAVKCGADAVIMSLHKTLPSFTQTALLHICSDRIPEERVASYLDIYETSSPSYVLMAGMDRCIRMLMEEAGERFFAYRKRLDEFYAAAFSMKNIHVTTYDEWIAAGAYAHDGSKLVISHRGLNGRKLYDIFLKKYRLMPEMASADYVLMMTSIMDTDEGFGRLTAALKELDARNTDRCGADRPEAATHKKAAGYQTNNIANERNMPIHKAVEGKHKIIALDEADGAVSADYVYLYPPGIPLLVPGEIVTRDMAESIRRSIDMGFEVTGIIEDGENPGIKIVYF